MSRSELLTDEAKPYVDEINKLVRDLYDRGEYMSAWVGTLPAAGEGPGGPQGMDQRLNYEPLPDAADDGRLPWFLYWEIYAVMRLTRPLLKPGMRLLDAGGTSSLFAFYLASLGYEVHAVDLNAKLVANAEKVSKTMGWSTMYSHVMNMANLEFPDEYFDFAYSICVFEHLDYPLKQDALREIARCLKPGGILSITFDYKNPAPGVAGYGKDTRLRNRISTPEDIQRNFLDTGLFEIAGNKEFFDEGQSYLVHRRFGNGEYTFGAIFLRKIKHPETRLESVVRALPRQVDSETIAQLSNGSAPSTPKYDKGQGSLFLSVIICTYRRYHLLRLALDSMLEQSLSPDSFEVIVVDNNSEDKTEQVVRKYAKFRKNIRYVREYKQGLSHSRNRGCKEARGDYVVYFDDDAQAHPRYLWIAYKTILKEKPDILGGPIYPYYTSPKPRWFKDEYEIRRHATETGWSRKCSISGSSFIIRRDVLKSLGMFDPSLGVVGNTLRLGEERAVLNAYRLRPLKQQRVYYHLGCLVYHHVPKGKMKARSYLKRYYVSGKAKAQIERKAHKHWGALARGSYIGRCWWNRVTAPVRVAAKKGFRCITRQFLLERASGVMFEMGRFVGCIPRRFRERGSRNERDSVS